MRDRISPTALWMLGFAFMALSSWVNVAQAQNITFSQKYTWTLPITNTDGTPIPATGPNALAKVEGWITSGTATTPDAPTTTPTFTLTPAGVTITQAITVPAGTTIRMRPRVCNNAGFCSDLPAAVISAAPGKPGALTGITVEFVTPTP